MDKKLKTEKVIMEQDGPTSDIGDFKEGDKLKLPPDIADAAVKAGIARRPDKGPAPKGDKQKKKEEVKDDGGK